MKNWIEITESDIYTYLDSRTTSIYHKKELAQELGKGSKIYESGAEGYGRFASLETLIYRFRVKLLKMNVLLTILFSIIVVSLFSMGLDLSYNENKWFSQAFFQTSDFGQGFLAFVSSWYLFKTFSKRQHAICIDLSNLSSHKMNIKNPA